MKTQQWASWNLPEPPASGCSTNEKKSWVMDCDVKLGVEHLGGIIGSFALATPSTFEHVLRTVRQIIEDDAKNSRESQERRQALLYMNISRGHPHESLCEYLYSFCAATWPLMMSDRQFATWAIEAKGNWEQPTSMLLGGCLTLVAISVHPDLKKPPACVASQAAPRHTTSVAKADRKWWQIWKP